MITTTPLLRTPAGALSILTALLLLLAPGCGEAPWEVIDLPFAIRSTTGASAEAFRIPDRGQLQEGAWADLVVFDLDRVDDPAGFLEPHQSARGMVDVLVDGVPVVDDGEFTDQVPGRVLEVGSGS